ncbi:cell division topological specificity factor MinE [Rhabdochromatium marinum]|uniref:cell division topological specificity factor MinE n=1 Tax=Rhabdochromatium marinum TaxID=48729 RepID=UPI001904DF30|nr:cell division topological specificity factor MinE [Rhabdochromatium marinum]MBK1647227.1 cell division topological specificity factor MinE [Rhabdochromatium marinum]
MGLLDNFRSANHGRGSASVAKERLQILVAHDRIARGRPSYLPKLEREILDLIRKYVDVDPNAVTVSYEQDERQEFLELNILLPDQSEWYQSESR